MGSRAESEPLAPDPSQEEQMRGCLLPSTTLLLSSPFRPAPQEEPPIVVGIFCFKYNSLF